MLALNDMSAILKANTVGAANNFVKSAGTSILTSWNNIIEVVYFCHGKI